MSTSQLAWLPTWRSFWCWWCRRLRPLRLGWSSLRASRHFITRLSLFKPSTLFTCHSPIRFFWNVFQIMFSWKQKKIGISKKTTLPLNADSRLNNSSWRFGWMACKANESLKMINFFNSILFISLMAVETGFIEIWPQHPVYKRTGLQTGFNSCALNLQI